jgi:GR25 family glycosyltransferase involved in LPS biosynthesis
MKRIFFYAAIMAVVLYACRNGQRAQLQVTDNTLVNAQTDAKAKGGYYKQNEMGLVADQSLVAADTAAMSVPPPFVPQSGAPNDPDWDKKIIKTANVTLDVKDYNAYNTAIHAKVKTFGAYIAQEQQAETDYQLVNNITIKVPVDKFEDVMNSFAGAGIKVVEKNITTEDVTGEVVDTKARLEAKKQVRERYLELLKQAKSMKDILDVQGEINTIQEDIESATGRVGYLVHAAAYSTINVKYYQYLNGVTARELEPSFLDKVGNAFKTGGEIITNIVLFAISVWPLCIAGVALVIYFKRGRRKVKETVV